LVQTQRHHVVGEFRGSDVAISALMLQPDDKPRLPCRLIPSGSFTSLTHQFWRLRT